MLRSTFENVLSFGIVIACYITFSGIVIAGNYFVAWLGNTNTQNTALHSIHKILTVQLEKILTLIRRVQFDLIHYVEE